MLISLILIILNLAELFLISLHFLFLLKIIAFFLLFISILLLTFSYSLFLLLIIMPLVNSTSPSLLKNFPMLLSLKNIKILSLLSLTSLLRILSSLLLIPNASPFVRFFFSCFSITPTVLNKAINLFKKHKRKLKLLPKPSALYKFFSLPHPNPSPNPSHHSYNNHHLSPDDISSLAYNMNLAITKAAASFDLSFFDSWLAAFCTLNSININSLSNKKRSSLFTSFSNAVDFCQKNV